MVDHAIRKALRRGIYVRKDVELPFVMGIRPHSEEHCRRFSTIVYRSGICSLVLHTIMVVEQSVVGQFHGAAQSRHGQGECEFFLLCKERIFAVNGRLPPPSVAVDHHGYAGRRFTRFGKNGNGHGIGIGKRAVQGHIPRIVCAPFLFDHNTGEICQMFSAYSRMLRSAAKYPAPAILMRD